MKTKFIKEAIATATELGYGDAVLAKLSRAKTQIEVDRIMKTARVTMAEHYTEMAMGRKGL